MAAFPPPALPSKTAGGLLVMMELDVLSVVANSESASLF
tara:strand:+ start:444 stop:560 length:117 start_codon:yes stop_codon:yes gene_type:complete